MTKATLYLDIEFDEQTTDAESVASALDTLMETALSTPDILSEYGNPRIGPFYVAENRAPRVVLNIYGGLVQDVFCSDPDTDVVVVDWDTEGCNPIDEGFYDVQCDDGRMHVVQVTEKGTYPIRSIGGTDCESALIAASLQEE
ncbi:MAG: hypothetical protein DWQ31_17110 [Planctomycetota bacterium]|nr:MAG: hypothetical protein DWQ31_17110 [Planctomycetota bacterium]REJ92074.1 MAG: hypothetical protein DWQ35_13060 [Planctomycetota bacterium]REK28610.1 MAG: hypothetical protein DWQ42_04650 [Planctomycetota bacterium]